MIYTLISFAALCQACDDENLPNWLPKWQCDNGKCIVEKWVCNDRDDCGDGSDEPGKSSCPAFATGKKETIYCPEKSTPIMTKEECIKAAKFMNRYYATYTGPKEELEKYPSNCIQLHSSYLMYNENQKNVANIDANPVCRTVPKCNTVTRVGEDQHCEDPEGKLCLKRDWDPKTEKCSGGRCWWNKKGDFENQGWCEEKGRKTTTGELCILPFTFDKREYTDCKKAPDGRTWCPTKLIDGEVDDAHFGYCRESNSSDLLSGIFTVSSVLDDNSENWGKKYLLTRTKPELAQSSKNFWHSKEEKNPFVILHLGCPKFVRKVVVRNRCDCCAGRNEGAQVSVDGKLCGTISGASNCAEEHVMCNAVGQNVKIELIGDKKNLKTLNIDTFQAFGDADC